MPEADFLGHYRATVEGVMSRLRPAEVVEPSACSSFASMIGKPVMVAGMALSRSDLDLISPLIPTRLGSTFRSPRAWGSPSSWYGASALGFSVRVAASARLLAVGTVVGGAVWAVPLHFMHYNFARVHTSLKTTPAVAGGVADHVWSLEEIAALLD